MHVRAQLDPGWPRGGGAHVHVRVAVCPDARLETTEEAAARGRANKPFAPPAHTRHRIPSPLPRSHLLGLEVKPKADPRARKAKDAVAPAAEASAAKPEVAEPKPSAAAPEPKAETGMDTEAEAGGAE